MGNGSVPMAKPRASLLVRVWTRASTISRGDLKAWFWGYFFIAPSLLGFLAFSIYPMGRTIQQSVERYSFFGNLYIGLKNYQWLVDDQYFYIALKNTALYILGIVPIGTFVSIVLAVLIFQLPRGAQTFFKSAYYLPVVVSGVVLSFIWIYLFQPSFGLLNYLLDLVHLPPQLWLADRKLAPWSLVLMQHGTRWGGSIILVCASLGNIPETLYEAATIDGASRLRQFFSITLPLLRPVAAYVTIMATVGTFQIFNQIWLMTMGGPNFASCNLTYYIYLLGFERWQFGRASAVAVVLLIITVAVAVLQFRAIGREVEY